MNIITRKEAARLGLSRYFTGKPCKRGHITERLSSCGQCVTCMKVRYQENKEEIKARVRKWTAENKERKRATDKAYRKKNADKVREKTRAWVEKNRERYTKNRREYYAKNKEHILLQCKEYIKKRPELRKKIALDYYYKNKDRVDEINRLRQKQVRKATPSWYDAASVRVKMKERDAMSKITGIQYHVDHIIPLQGENVCGLHIAANMRVIPARDNLAKSNKLQNTLGLAI